MSSVAAVATSTTLAVLGVLVIGRDAPVAGLDPAVLGSLAVMAAAMIGAATVLMWAARGAGDLPPGSSRRVGGGVRASRR